MARKSKPTPPKGVFPIGGGDEPHPDFYVVEFHQGGVRKREGVTDKVQAFSRAAALVDSRLGPVRVFEFLGRNLGKPDHVWEITASRTIEIEKPL